MNPPYSSLSAWIIYSAVYVAAFVVLAALAALDQPAWSIRETLTTLTSITTSAIGIGLLVALSWELGGYIMVLASKLKQQIFDRGREEGVKVGREEGVKVGRQEGRQAEREAWEAWNARREAALAAGEPFDEPPPSRNHTTTN